MSEIASPSHTRPRKPRVPVHKRLNEIDDFRTWLASLDMNNPIVHVNGPHYATAVVTVDFGTPLEEVTLTTDQTNELISRLRSAAKLICGDKNIHIQNDIGNGIWYASVG